MKFIAIDLETANPRYHSICQIGIGLFENGELVDKQSHLIDPKEPFADQNISIHGIRPCHVAGKPTYSDLYDVLCETLRDQLVVCHGHFDRVAIGRANEKNGLPDISCMWLDSSKVARRAWPEFSKSGYGLGALAKHFGIDFRHHDAMADAITAGFIIVKAVEKSGISPQGWVSETKRRISERRYDSITRQGSTDGPLSGECLVFTGRLSLTRQEAADKASKLGAEIASNLTRKTTILVVGDQDINYLAGHEKSAKHRKAEELLLQGQAIRIITEEDFLHITDD